MRGSRPLRFSGYQVLSCGAFTTKKKAFYIGSNDLSTSITTRGGNTVSLNTDIGWRIVFEGRPFYIGYVA